MGGFIVVIALAVLIIVIIAKTAVVVPQQSAFVVERLGKYSGTLGAGFHILVPFLDVVRYRHSLKEQAVDIPPQVCITRDNVQVSVDGVLYLKVLNPERASYGIADYNFGISQLAQTTLRSEFGKIELDRPFEERTNINTQVVSELDKDQSPGASRMRYEIKTSRRHTIFSPPWKNNARERENAALILTPRVSATPRSTARKARNNRRSSLVGKKQQQINEAEGEAAAILAIADATATACAKSPTLFSTRGFEAVHCACRELPHRIRQTRPGRQHADLTGHPERRGLHDCLGDERHQTARERE